MSHALLTVRLTLAVVCLVAAVGKARDRVAFGEFTRVLGAIGLPGRAARPVAVATVAAELAVAALLPWPATATVGCAAAAALFTVLTVGVAVAVRGGRVVRCRCFGRAGALLGTAHTVRNGLLAAAAVAAWWGSAVAPSTDRPGVAGVAAAAAFAGLAALVVVSWDDLAALTGGPVTTAASA